MDGKRSILLKNLEKVLDQLDEIFLFISDDTRILYANTAYSRLMGIPRSKVVGRLLRDLEPQSRLIEVLEVGRPVFRDYSYIESVGMDIVGNAFPVYDGDRKIGAMAIFRPISIHSGPHRFSRHPEGERGGANDPFGRLIGESQQLKNVIRIARKVARSDTTVLLRGETGVGKELFARAIHESGSEGPFVALNIASLPESLLESELFGYEAGAFTGAKTSGKPGLVERAEGGTLFLDEIGEISPALQTKLLRVLQERSVIRVGGTEPRSVGFRLIAATNRDLETLVENGALRPDFYYRINVFPIHLPLLRERGSDVIRLAGKFKQELEEKRGEEKTFSPRVLEVFERYDWPGNVRELQSCVEYMYTLSEGRLMDLQHLPPAIVERGCPVSRETEAESIGFSSCIPENHTLQEAVELLEKEMIRQALDRCRTRSEAIRLLGISRKAFYMKLKKYGFE